MVFSTFDSYQLVKSINMAVKNAINPVEFESDFLKTNENKALQSHRILQTFVWWEASPMPLTIQASVKFCTFMEQYLCSLRTYHLQLGKFPNFKALFTDVLMDITHSHIALRL